MEHKRTSTSKKDGNPWVDRKGNEWQRWWCGITDEDHAVHGKCRVSIPQKTGRKVKPK